MLCRPLFVLALLPMACGTAKPEEIARLPRELLDAEVVRRYLLLLGLGRWMGRWVAANAELAAKLGLGRDPGGPRKGTKDGVVRRRATPAPAPEVMATTRPRTSAGGDEDVDYEDYLELYAENPDGGRRPKLSRQRFSELSDEMMELVTFSNIQELPPWERRRMEELEYLLIA